MTNAVVTALSLREIKERSEQEHARESMARLKKEQEEAAHLRAIFMEAKVGPNAVEKLNAAIVRAAEAGRSELQLLTFPASYCTDGGRRINNQEADWSDSLQGIARVAYDYYARELMQLGYRLRCQVISYPDGNIGEIAMILSW